MWFVCRGVVVPFVVLPSWVHTVYANLAMHGTYIKLKWWAYVGTLSDFATSFRHNTTKSLPTPAISNMCVCSCTYSVIITLTVEKWCFSVPCSCVLLDWYLCLLVSDQDTVLGAPHVTTVRRDWGVRASSVTVWCAGFTTLLCTS
jgi:hypothetical protein